MDFILASGSPRRKEILETIGMEFSIIESDTDETAAEGMAPGETVRLLSGEKARAVAEKVSRDAVIIGADTIVYMDGEIFGKPGGEKDARRMLSSLSGRCHEVYTGITAVIKDGKSERTVFAEDSAKVWFKALSDAEISAYIASGEPFGKAGAYAVQGKGSLFVPRIEGDFFTVVGLSPAVLGKLFSENGIDITKNWVSGYKERG